MVISDSGCFCVIDAIDLDHWLYHVVGSSIEVFILYLLTNQQRYNLPAFIFSSCPNINDLRLNCCLINPPIEFIGFQNLKILKLQAVTIYECYFKKMIAGCPLFERMSLIEVDGVTCFNIRSSNLIELYFKGSFKYTVVVSPKLERLYVDDYGGYEPSNILVNELGVPGHFETSYNNSGCMALFKGNDSFFGCVLLGVTKWMDYGLDG